MGIISLCFPAILIILGFGLLNYSVVNLRRKRNNPLPAKSFGEVEQEFQQLQGKFRSKVITEEQFKSRLHDMMLQDEKGQWWMIGYETGQWYYHDGEKWVSGTPAISIGLAGKNANKKTVPALTIWLSGIGGLILLVGGLIIMAKYLLYY